MKPPADLIAVIADVHGNRAALEAVLLDIRRRGIRRVLNLGDSLYGPLDPAGTAELLLDWPVVSVSGNEDRILLDPPADYEHRETLDFTRARLSPSHRQWLRGLPRTQLIDGQMLMCHGTPQRDDDYLFWEITAAGAVEVSAALLEQRWGGTKATLLLAGHDHRPNLRRTADGRLFLNPGSVGLPAYRDTAPYPHAMESGSPHARFAVLTRNESGWLAEHHAVVYDWACASRCAWKNGRGDWAQWLLTGRA